MDFKCDGWIHDVASRYEWDCASKSHRQSCPNGVFNSGFLYDKIGNFVDSKDKSQFHLMYLPLMNHNTISVSTLLKFYWNTRNNWINVWSSFGKCGYANTYCIQTQFAMLSAQQKPKFETKQRKTTIKKIFNNKHSCVHTHTHSRSHKKQ